MVAIDSTFLSLMLHPRAKPPKDPATGKALERIHDRIEKLLEDLDSESERIILPTPVLSEFLILAGKDGPEYLDRLSGMKNILVKPFDEKAAIELAPAKWKTVRQAASEAALRARGQNSDSTVKSLQ
jgi:predicted nucleic acid-binding protein